MSNLSYKVHYNDQIRRFSLPYESSYHQLRRKIEEVYSGISKGFQLYYVDEEEDQISVNSQTELDEAKRLCKQIIRLTIRNPEAKPQAPPTQPRSQPQSQQQPQTPVQKEEGFFNFTFQNPLAQSSFVQMLVFAQPYLTNPTLLKTVLPYLLSEMNKNNYIPQEEINKINQMADQFLDKPFVKEFLTVKLPKILQKITGTTPPPPPPTPPPAPTTTEQIQEFVMPFFTMAQTFVQNLSQNIQSQLTPSPAKESEPEPKKPEVVNKDTAPKFPVYQPPPVNYNPAQKPNPGQKPNLAQKPNPAPPAVAPVPVSLRYDNELKKLKEFGFSDTKFLIELLNENNGDIYKVIDILSGN